MTLAVVEPTSLVAVHDQCAAVEAWAGRCESIAELRDASNKLAAIDEYLARTSSEGRARVAAAQRRLEVRVGELLGPTTPGARTDREPSIAIEGSSLTKDERHAFRAMAEHPDVVEDVIADSTDEQPASRRKVTRAIAEHKPAPARRPPLAPQLDTAGWNLRRAADRLTHLAGDDRYAHQSEQVAAQLRSHLSHVIEACQDLMNITHRTETR